MTRLHVKYAILTCAIFLPLFWAFVYVRNVYPIATWNVMLGGSLLERGRTYWILRGETVSGENVDVRPMDLTNALYSRTWTMVNATFGNQSFLITNPHPENVKILQKWDGWDYFPPQARVPDLLRAWGELYNERLPASSPQRLKVIRLDMYRWEGGQYANYENYIDSWRETL